MPEVQLANRVLAARATVRHATSVARAAENVEALGAVVDEWWTQLIGLVIAGKPVGRHASLLAGRVNAEVGRALRAAVRDGWADVAGGWEGVVPARLLQWSKALREETAAEKHARLEKESGMTLFEPPDSATTEKILRSTHWFEGGRTYEERLATLSKKVLDSGMLAKQISAGYAAGRTPAQIERQVRPLVQGIKTSSQRIVRTETLRISEELQREGYARADHLIAGLRVWAVLDDRTRPHHAARNGRFYTKDGCPIVPDEPNCRCYTSPVLRDPDGALPDSITGRDGPAPKAVINGTVMDLKTISDWFNQQTPARQAALVGSERFGAVRSKVGATDQRLAMYLDGEGFMISSQQLGNDTPEAILARAGLEKKPKTSVAVPDKPPELKPGPPAAVPVVPVVKNAEVPTAPAMTKPVDTKPADAAAKKAEKAAKKAADQKAKDDAAWAHFQATKSKISKAAADDLVTVKMAPAQAGKNVPTLDQQLGSKTAALQAKLAAKEAAAKKAKDDAAWAHFQATKAKIAKTKPDDDMVTVTMAPSQAAVQAKAMGDKTAKLQAKLAAKKAQTASAKAAADAAAASLEATKTQAKAMVAGLEKAQADAKAAIATAPAKAPAPAKPKAQPKPKQDRSSPRAGTKADYKAQHAKWVANLTDDQRKAIRTWSGVPYSDIRKYQTGKYKSVSADYDAKIAKTTRDMESATRNAPRFVGNVSRGIRLPEGHELVSKWTKVGGTVEIDCYTSTTISQSVARKFANPVGGEEGIVWSFKTTKGVDIDPISQHSGVEKEILLEKGQSIRILSATKTKTSTGRTLWMVEAEEA